MVVRCIGVHPRRRRTARFSSEYQWHQRYKLASWFTSTELIVSNRAAQENLRNLLKYLSKLP